MQSAKPSAIVKPTLETRYHIDYSWFERSGEDLRTYLLSHLSPDQRERLSQTTETREVDYIDPETGEVSKLDELQLAIRSASLDPDFINPHTAVVDSIFRVFLANGNKPVNSQQISEYIGRPASLVLKTLSGGRVYKGIRPTTN
ncbi:MAG: hypothetical protein IPK17_03980 [Chloroflexi bacterium]|uniref:hypothetical protein n=1 Tax=Candidatus Flexifilum breve TaxID=3140694 RepID=UPI0031362949|nr:hypothetical protein [Chloroflexota bacterium]